MFFWILAASALPGAGSPCAICVTATATATDKTNEVNHFMMTWREFDRTYLAAQSAFSSVGSRLRSVGGGFGGAMTTQCWRRWRRRRRRLSPFHRHSGWRRGAAFFSVVEDTGSRCFPPDRYSRVCVPANPHAHPPTRKRPGRHLSRARGTLRFRATNFYSTDSGRPSSTPSSPQRPPSDPQPLPPHRETQSPVAERNNIIIYFGPQSEYMYT